jgi:hypothetical protein
MPSRPTPILLGKSWAREAKVRIKKKAISGDFMNYKSVDRVIELQVSRVGEQFRLI